MPGTEESPVIEQKRQFRTAEYLLTAGIDQLPGELANQRTPNVFSNAELERMRSQITTLQEQCARSELWCGQLEENWQQAIALTQELKARLQAKEDEFRVAEPNAQQQKEAANMEHRPRSELDWLIREDKERNQILQNRNDELMRVKAEIDSLRDRFLQKLPTSQTQIALSEKTERMHTEFLARLDFLQKAELSQKEWTLQERDATARMPEQTYHEQIESLREHWTEKEAAPNPSNVLGEPRIQVTDSAHPSDQHWNQSPRSRRWKTGFAGKRRWKS